MKSALFCFLVFDLMTQSLSACFGYDNELIQYYSSQRPDRALLIENAKSVTNVQKSDLELVESWTASSDVLIARNLSCKLFGKRDVVSHFFVHELNRDYEPFVGFLADYEIPNPSKPKETPEVIKFLNLVQCETLELFDVKLSQDQLNSLENLKTVKHLGLPVRGIRFNSKFSFPESLELLVVRNCELSSYFFCALQRSNNIKQLVLLNCSFWHASPMMSELGYDDKSWNNLPKLFDGISCKLQSIKILECDPDIFNYMISEEWPLLDSMSVDILSANKSAINYLILKKSESKLLFPSLSRVSIRSFISEKYNLKKAFSDGCDLSIEVSGVSPRNATK